MSKDEKQAREFTITEERPATKQISGELKDFHTRVYFADAASDPPNHPRVEFISRDGSVSKDMKLGDLLSDDNASALFALLDTALEGAFSG